MVTAHEKTPACSQDTPLLLACPNSTIAKVLFGEYGTPSGDCAAARQENGTIFPFYIQMIVLPRQARNKHRKNSKNVPFSCSGGFAGEVRARSGEGIGSGAENVLSQLN